LKAGVDFKNSNEKPVDKIVFKRPQRAAKHLKHEERRAGVLFGQLQVC
jgi:hypothetical protein